MSENTFRDRDTSIVLLVETPPRFIEFDGDNTVVSDEFDPEHHGITYVYELTNESITDNGLQRDVIEPDDDLFRNEWLDRSEPIHEPFVEE